MRRSALRCDGMRWRALQSGMVWRCSEFQGAVIGLVVQWSVRWASIPATGDPFLAGLIQDFDANRVYSKKKYTLGTVGIEPTTFRF